MKIGVALYMKLQHPAWCHSHTVDTPFEPLSAQALARLLTVAVFANRPGIYALACFQMATVSFTMQDCATPSFVEDQVFRLIVLMAPGGSAP